MVSFWIHPKEKKERRGLRGAKERRKGLE